MDTRTNSISYASFITKIYCWSVLYLKRKGAFKHIALLSVVLFCTLTRYVVLSFDKIDVKQTKTNPANFKQLEFPLGSAKTILKSEAVEMKQRYQHRIKPLNFKKGKNNSLYIYALN